MVGDGILYLVRLRVKNTPDCSTRAGEPYQAVKTHRIVVPGRENRTRPDRCVSWCSVYIVLNDALFKKRRNSSTVVVYSLTHNNTLCTAARRPRGTSRVVRFEDS